MNRPKFAMLFLALMLSGCGGASLNNYTSSSTASSTSGGSPTDQPDLGCNSYGKASNLGINVGNLSFAALSNPNVIQALTESHVGWIRVNMYWAWTEPQEGVFQWSAIDDALTSLKASNITPLIILNGPTPCWAIGASCSSNLDEMPSQAVSYWSNFVMQAVSRYKNQVTYWEIWNEPDLIESIDLTNPSDRLVQYRDNILTPAATVIHSVDANAKVVAPALAAISEGNTAVGSQLQNALAFLLASPAGNLVDIVSIHAYYPEILSDVISSANAGVAASGQASKPVWITEAGAGGATLSSVSDPQQTQSDYLMNDIQGGLTNLTTSKIFWFALTDSADSSGNHTNDYGLINNTDYTSYIWTPRLAYTTLQSLITSECNISG